MATEGRIGAKALGQGGEGRVRLQCSPCEQESGQGSCRPGGQVGCLWLLSDPRSGSAPSSPITLVNYLGNDL